MKLDLLLNGLEAEILSGSRLKEVSGVVCDSRQTREGSLFVALHGTEKDGMQYVEDAVARGASVIVSDKPRRINGGVTFVLVKDDIRSVLARLSARFHNTPAEKLKVIGITGTNGKTTTAFVTKRILSEEGLNPGIIGTVEYNIGSRIIPASRTTPDAPMLQSMMAQMIGAGCKSVVMEVSSHALDQNRTGEIDFDVGVFTNLTRDHLDYHKNTDHYFAAKKKLFTQLGSMKKKAAAVINIDDEYGRKIIEDKSLKCDIISYGTTSLADVRISDLTLSHEGSRFVLSTPWGTQDIGTNLLGRFNVFNITASIAASVMLGVNFTKACELMKKLPVVPGRLEEIRTGRSFQVFVDYAHTDDALEKVLITLKEITRGRLITVFGCGGNRDKTKRPVMGSVASRLSDFSYVTSDNPRKEEPMAIIEQIVKGFGNNSNYEVCADRKDAMTKAILSARDGDIVLIAGKGHENFQEFANTTVSFDDRQVASEILADMV